jgi:hypothetical protein
VSGSPRPGGRGRARAERERREPRARGGSFAHRHPARRAAGHPRAAAALTSRQGPHWHLLGGVPALTNLCRDDAATALRPRSAQGAHGRGRGPGGLRGPARLQGSAALARRQAEALPEHREWLRRRGRRRPWTTVAASAPSPPRRASPRESQAHERRDLRALPGLERQRGAHARALRPRRTRRAARAGAGQAPGAPAQQSRRQGEPASRLRPASSSGSARRWRSGWTRFSRSGSHGRYGHVRK